MAIWMTMDSLCKYCLQQHLLFVLNQILFCLDQTPATVSLQPVCKHVTEFLIVLMSWNAEIKCG